MLYIVIMDDAHSSHGTEDTLCTPSADDAHSSHGTEDVLHTMIIVLRFVKSSKHVLCTFV